MIINKLSIIIPVYNEAATVKALLDKVVAVKLIGELEKEIILVDDHSTDGSNTIIDEYIEQHQEIQFQYKSKERNEGKGAAIHTGIELATGGFLIIQDADLEYDPNDYNVLLKPVLDDFADVVYGSRFKGGQPHRVLFFWHSIGNKFLTGLSNMFTNLNLTDMETCYKLFRIEHIRSLNFHEKRFGFEPEVTSKISRTPNIRIYEVGIAYYGRTYNEGKKINWKDGIHAIWCILKYGLWAR